MAIVERASAFKVKCWVGWAMKAYRVKGDAPFGSQRQGFSYDIPATDDKQATERVYSNLGARHNINRRQINIDSVNEIDPRTSTEPKILHHFREQIESAGDLPQAASEEE